MAKFEKMASFECFGLLLGLLTTINCSPVPKPQESDGAQESYQVKNLNRPLVSVYFHNGTKLG